MSSCLPLFSRLRSICLVLGLFPWNFNAQIFQIITLFIKVLIQENRKLSRYIQRGQVYLRGKFISNPVAESKQFFQIQLSDN